MMRNLLLTVALAAVCCAAAAQNLNPTVEVTNTYEGNLSGIQKPDQLIQVPDSVTRFNLDFDYAVFENPYRGAYEFQPYMVQLRPLPAPSTEKRFFLRAGAGYSLHPELQLLWTPVSTRRVKLNVYADHRSYMGYTRGISPVKQADETVFTDDGTRTGCGDLDTRSGVSGRYLWDSGAVEADLQYRNLYAEHEDQLSRLDHGFTGKARVYALDTPRSVFHYDLGVQYAYRTEGFDPIGGWAGGEMGRTWQIGQSRLDVTGTFGPNLDFGRLRMDIGATLLRHTAENEHGLAQDYYTGNLQVTPRFLFELGSWRFNLGARLSTFIRSADAGENYTRRSGYLFPDAYADWYLWDDRLVFQAEATGGDHVNGYFDLVDRHHFLRMPDFVLDNSVELVRASVGVRGKLFSRFQYNLKGGYTRWKGAMLETWAGSQFPLFTPVTMDMFFGELTMNWKSDWLNVDARMKYNWNDVAEDRVFAPAAFTGTARALYNWGWRIQAGASVNWSTARYAWAGNQYYTIPGFADLGLEGEFAVNRTWAVWAKVGNLLGQTVQLYPLHAENGVYFTLGFRLAI